MRWMTLILVLGTGKVIAQPIYTTNPNWRSTDRHYATGGAFADLNNDGWLDFVVANGNDIERERVGVYYSNHGVLPTAPGWESNDLAYHGHLTIGDVNRDGWLDVAVAVLLPEGGPGVKLYLNQNGQLTGTPAWTSTHSFYGWHPSFGDPDGDGDLDLAIGDFWPYGAGRHNLYIFFNQNGTLERTASWHVTNVTDVGQAAFCDVDNDGDHDLVSIARNGNFLYRNQNGAISTTTAWASTDNNRQFPNTLAFGDVTGDGRFDLVMSDNNQLSGGSGRFKLYRGLNTGVFETPPGWSYLEGMVSAVALADLNADGHLDLATGAWWDNLRLFLNSGSGFPNTPNWSSTVTPVIEAICFGDVNRDGLRFRQESKGVNGSRKLFYLEHQPIERLVRVVADGVDLPLTDYCYSLKDGWISLPQAPASSLVIEYTYSTMLDMGVTDWENNGNLIFYHLPPPGDVNRDGCVDDSDLAAVIFAFGTTGSGIPEDLNHNAIVDDGDLAIVVFNFGTGC